MHRTPAPRCFLLLLAVAAGCLTAPDPCPGPARSLGLGCALSADCPDGHECLHLLGVGSQVEGFCTIACGGDDPAACTGGFPGPGLPTCAGGHCVVQCTVPGLSGECPAGLTCTESAPRGPSYCVRPP